MTFHQYLLNKLESTVMITLTVGDETFQYNFWNWFWETNPSQFHLLRNDYTIGHIIYGGEVQENDDGSISLMSKYHPKNIVLNFYFGGVQPQ